MRNFVLAVMIAVLIPIAVSGQEADPIDRPVADTELSASYARDEKSDHLTNREFRITTPNGTAQDAVGTRFERGSEEFQIVSVRERKSTYDSIRTASFDRVIYLAKKLERPIVDPPPKKPIGRSLLVAVDYRPLHVPVPPPPPRYEAYIAEVKLGKKETKSDRWEYVKVTGAKKKRP